MAGRLYDYLGRPVELGRLKDEEASPTLTGVRQIFSGHPERGLTPARLAAMLREAEEGDPIAYLELAEAMEEKDPDYLGVLGTRKRAVSQLEITVVAASDESADEDLAEFVRGALLEREELEDELFDMLDAIGKGFSATEILWETSEREWRPARLEWRDPRWFRFDRADGRTLRLLDEGGRETPLAPFKFVVHVHKAKSGLPIRGGLARPIAWAYLFKNYAVKDWATFLEAYAQPWRLGKYHAGATEDEKRKLLAAVGSLSSDAAAIVPEGMTIEMLEMGTKGATSDAYEKNADYLNRRIQIAVLGQTLTTEVKGGSLAAAKVHDAVRDDIKRADAKQLASTLNRDLVRPLIDLNKGPRKRYPRLVIGLRDSVDLKEYAESMGAMIDRGLRVEQSVIRDKFGVPEPAEDAELMRPSGSPAEAGPEIAEQGARRCPVHGVAVNARGAEGDALDALIAEAAGEWEPMLAPLLDGVRRIVEEARDFDELKARLAEAYPLADVERLVETLARAGFVARVAGRLGADLEG